MQRKAGFGLGVRKLYSIMAGSRGTWVPTRPSTSCEAVGKPLNVSGPQAFFPVGGREMPSSLSSLSVISAEPLFNLLLASLI